MSIWPQIQAFVQANWLAFVVGLLTGGFVGNVKTVLEIWDRFAKPNIAVLCTLNGRGAGEPNYVFITNLSGGPLILNYWEIVWRHPTWKFWHWRNREQIVEDAYDRASATLLPHKEEVLTFCDGAGLIGGRASQRGGSYCFATISRAKASRGSKIFPDASGL
jgi:hypothetical protein